MANITIHEREWWRPVIDGAMLYTFTDQDIGKLFIRTRPYYGDWCYTPGKSIKTGSDIEKRSVQFLGIDDLGRFTFRSPRKRVVTFEENDGCWISVKKFINRFEEFQSQEQKK